MKKKEEKEKLDMEEEKEFEFLNKYEKKNVAFAFITVGSQQ